MMAGGDGRDDGRERDDGDDGPLPSPLSPLTLGSPCSALNDTIVDRPSGLIGSRHKI